MSKYSALGTYLLGQHFDEVPMRFSEIEKIVGIKLPNSAFKHRPWWSNNDKNSVMTRVWLDAGFRTARVDMENRKLVFERVHKVRSFSEHKKNFDEARDAKPKEGRYPMIGALKGTFTIEVGWDLTKPALDPEELKEWEANLDRTADMIADGLRGKRPG